MRPSPKHLLGRAAAKARQSAAGSPTPAGVEPPAPPPEEGQPKSQEQPKRQEQPQQPEPQQPDPQQPDPQEPEPQPTRATARQRVAMRRRIRRLRRTREVLLRELGALVVEMHRQDRQNPRLLKVKGAEVAALDRELRGLQAALAEGQTIEQVVAAGVAGRCSSCATLMGIDDRFCPNCGAPAGPPKPEAETGSEEAPADKGSQEAPAGERKLSAAGTTKE